MLYIKDNESYNKFCSMMDTGLNIVELNNPYIVTDDFTIMVTQNYSFVFDDIIDFLTKGKSEYQKDTRKLIIADNKQLLAEAIQEIKKHEILSFDTETTGLHFMKDSVIGWSFCGTEGLAYYIPYMTWDKDKQTLVEVHSYEEVKATLRLLVGRKLVTWNGTFDTKFVKRFFGVELMPNVYFDGQIAKHLLDEEGDLSLKGNAILFQKQIGLDMNVAANQEQIELKENIIANGGKATKGNMEMYKADLQVLGKYAAADADLTLRLCALLDGMLYEEGLDKFFFDEESMPLYRDVTYVMESYGVSLDLAKINEDYISIKERMSSMYTDIYNNIISYDEFNLYLKDVLDKKIKVSTKGSFAKKVLDFYNVKIPVTDKGKVSINKKFIESLPDCIVKNFLLGKEYLPEDVVFEIKKQILQESEGCLINITSTDQLGNFTFNYLNEEPLSTTDKGKPQFTDDTLEVLAKKGYVWAEKLSSYNKLDKIKSTYIERFLNNHIDGKYYFYYKQHGTISGRYSSDAQQMPRPKEEGELPPEVLYYNNRIREYMVAPEGTVFIDDDYESLEPHTFSHVSTDIRLQEIFHKGYDFYSTIAIRTENLEGVSADKKADNYLGKVDKPKRQASKEYSLGIPYGKTPYALKFSLNCSEKEAEDKYNGYLNGFPDLAKWMKDSDEFVKKNGYMKTQVGRVRHLGRVKELYKIHGDRLLDFKYRNSIKAKYGSEEINKMYRDYKNGLNNGRNFQIQGLAASIINRAMINISKTFKERKIDGQIVSSIHDQCICVVNKDQAEEAKKIVQDCMENSVKLSVKLKAVPAIAYNWKEGH